MIEDYYCLPLAVLIPSSTGELIVPLVVYNVGSFRRITGERGADLLLLRLNLIRMRNLAPRRGFGNHISRTVVLKVSTVRDVNIAVDHQADSLTLCVGL